MAKSYSNEFRKDAVCYKKDHPELTTREAADNLGVPYHTLYSWLRDDHRKKQPEAYDEKGNLSDLEKENLRLQRELRNAKDALEILKKAISSLED